MIENWRTHPTYTNYAISDQGRVCRLTTGPRNVTARRILKTPSDVSGYAQVNLCGPKKKHCRVHILVLEIFVGAKQKGQESRHLNGNSLDNRAENLLWGTSKENYEDKVLHGRDAKGERNGQAKLTEEDVLSIRSLYAGGVYSQRVLADQFNVAHSRISYIVNRINWKHI